MNEKQEFYIKSEKEYCLQRIRKECKRLLLSVQGILNKASEEDAKFNSLGELQGNALILDNLIIEYESKKELIRVLKNLEKI